jgi:hypothetical protein
MGSTVSSGRVSTPVDSLDRVRPQMARAALAVNDGQLLLTAIVRDALLRSCGSLKAAAITMQIDQGQLTRELDSGKLNLARLDLLDAATKAELANRLTDAFGVLADPKDYIRKRLRDMEDAVAEFKQFVETTRVA